MNLPVGSNALLIAFDFYQFNAYYGLFKYFTTYVCLCPYNSGAFSTVRSNIQSLQFCQRAKYTRSDILNIVWGQVPEDKWTTVDKEKTYFIIPQKQRIECNER